MSGRLKNVGSGSRQARRQAFSPLTKITGQAYPLGRSEVCWKRPPKKVKMVVQRRFVAYRQIRCRSWCASLARELDIENCDKLGSGGILTVKFYKKISRLVVPEKGPFLRACGVGVHWVSDSTYRCTCKGAPTCEHVVA